MLLSDPRNNDNHPEYKVFHDEFYDLFLENRQSFFKDQPVLMKNYIFFTSPLRVALSEQQQSIRYFFDLIINAKHHNNPLSLITPIRTDMKRTFANLQEMLEKEVLTNPF
jgi:hypothetical protein